MIYNAYSIPIYCAKVKNHQSHLALIEKAIQEHDLFHKARSWDCGIDTTIGSEKNSLIPWEPIINDVQEHLTNYISMFEPYKDYRIYTNAWLSRYWENDYQEVHNHVGEGTVLSCAYMLKTKDSTSSFLFCNQDLDFFTTMGIQGVCKSFPHRTFRPDQEEGTVIIFPSNLDHYVTKHKSKKDRLTISMNFMIKPEESL